MPIIKYKKVSINTFRLIHFLKSKIHLQTCRFTILYCRVFCMKPGNLFIGQEIHKSMQRLARRRCCHWEAREETLLSRRLFVFRCLFNTSCNSSRSFSSRVQTRVAPLRCLTRFLRANWSAFLLRVLGELSEISPSPILALEFIVIDL